MRQVLKYIYTGKVEITAESVINLTKAAKALKVLSLERQCWSFIDSSVKPERTCMTGIEPVTDGNTDSAVICVGDVRPSKQEESEFFIQNTILPVSRPVTGN